MYDGVRAWKHGKMGMDKGEQDKQPHKYQLPWCSLFEANYRAHKQTTHSL